MLRAKAIIFDIDGTLYPEVSWTSLTAALGGSTEEHLRIYEDYRTGAIDYPTSRTRLIGLWKATGRANRAAFQMIFDGWKLFPGAKTTIRELARSHEVCLITGSFDLWAETVARRLGVARYYANTALVWDAAGELESYDYVLDQAGLKLAQFREFCAVSGLETTDCVVVGDSDNDLELFKATGQGVAIGEAPEALKAVSLAQLKSVTELPALLAKDGGAAKPGSGAT